MMLTKSLITTAGIAAVAFAVGVPRGPASDAAPVGGPAFGGADYVTLDHRGALLRDAFNGAAGRIRVVAYVAPTCGGCLRGAQHLQDEVLDRVESPGLSVLVVWVPKNGARERNVPRVLDLVTDRRATQYWDEHGAVVDALDERLGMVGRACAGAFLVYGPDAEWDAAGPPEPAYWSDAHSREFEQHGPRFEPDALRAAIERLLEGPAQ